MRIALEIFAYSCAAGLFVVPIFAAVQTWSGEDRRARVIGAVNTLNSIYMVGGSIAVTLILKLTGIDESTRARGARRRQYSRRASISSAACPPIISASCCERSGGYLFRLEVVGLENLPEHGQRNVISLNHVSFLDAPIILSLLDAPPIFAVDHGIANRWWMQPFLKLADARPLDPSKPLAARALIQEVRQGRRLVIFPEGRITVTGSLMKIYDGAAMIAEKSDALVTPVRLDGPERTPFSRLNRGADRTPLVSQRSR